MAANETIEDQPNRQEMAAHERDYSKFIKLFKYGAIFCFLFGFAWLTIVKLYW